MRHLLKLRLFLSVEIDRPLMTSQAKPQILDVDGVTVIELGPEFARIDESMIPAVAEVFREYTAHNHTPVVVDLSHTQFFSSSFIELLFRLWNRAKGATGTGFALCCVNEYCQEILLVTNLNSLWPIYPDRASAVEAVRSASGS